LNSNQGKRKSTAETSGACDDSDGDLEITETSEVNPKDANEDGGKKKGSISKSVPKRLQSILTKNKLKDFVSKCNICFVYLFLF